MNIIKVIEILPQDVFLRSATLFTTAFSEEIIGLSSCNRINLKCNIFYLLKKIILILKLIPNYIRL